MSKKHGIVMEVNNKTACLLTSDAEFVKVKINKTAPVIGSYYTGKKIFHFYFNKFITTAACLILSLFIGSGAYAYYTPVASVFIKMPPIVELKINKWNKIIDVTPLTDKSKHILASTKLKNKSITTGLSTILEQAEKGKLINKKETNIISFCVNNNKNLDLKISELETQLNNKNFNFKIINDSLEANKSYVKNQEKTSKDSNVHYKNKDKSVKNNNIKTVNNHNIENSTNKNTDKNKSNNLNNNTNIVNQKNKNVIVNLKTNNSSTKSSNIENSNKLSTEKPNNINKKTTHTVSLDERKKYKPEKQKSHQKEGNSKNSSN